MDRAWIRIGPRLHKALLHMRGVPLSPHCRIHRRRVLPQRLRRCDAIAITILEPDILKGIERQAGNPDNFICA